VFRRPKGVAEETTPFPKSSGGSTTVLPPFPDNGRVSRAPLSGNDTLAADLRGLSAALSSIDQSSSERLDRLAAALMDPYESELWIDVDLRRAFHTERLAYAYAVHQEGGEAPPLIDTMDKVRNVMILVPIMLTWFALAQAVRDYSKYIQANPDQIGQPFLLLWQQGFDGNASWHSPSFSAVALADALVILLIVVITFFAHGRREEREEDIAMTARDFQAHLDNALGEATVRFAMARTMKPNTLAEAIGQVTNRFDTTAQELLTRLRVEHDRLDQIAARREREFSDFAVFASGMRAGAEESQRMLIDLRQVSTALQTAIEDLTSEIGIAGEQQRTLLSVTGGLERVIGAATQTDAALVRQLADAARNLTETTDRAVAGADAAAKAGQVASEAVRHIAEVAASLADGQLRIEQAIAAESEANTRLADALRGSGSGVTNATRAMADIASTLVRVRDDLSQMSDLTGTQTTALQRLLADQNGMATSMQHIAHELSSVGNATAQRQREITDEAAALIQRIDTLTSVLSRAAAGLPTPDMMQEAVSQAVRREISASGYGPADPATSRPGGFPSRRAGNWPSNE
jgi:Mg2+ and Co2+ transporter CorA